MADDILELLYEKRECESKRVFCGYRRNILLRKMTAVEEGLVLCHVCEGILRDANMHQGEITCLLCAPDDVTPHPVNRVINVVLNLESKCPLAGKCEWVGLLIEAEDHLKECGYIKILCACNSLVERKDIAKHLDSKCKLRKVRCDYCNETCSAEEMATHLDGCLHFPTVCVNGCGEQLTRDKQMKHSRDECPLAEADCPYKQFGCDSEGIERRNISDHKEAMAPQHIDLLIRSIFDLKLESIRLSKILEKQALTLQREKQAILETCWNMLSMEYLDGVEWTLDAPNKYERMQGPLFYISGHKMECYSMYSEEVMAPSEGRVNCCLQFCVRRLQCGVGSPLFVNECRSILTDCADGLPSHYEVHAIKGNLDEGKEFDVAEFWLVRTRTSLSRMKVRIYFDLTPPSRLHQSLFQEELDDAP